MRPMHPVPAMRPMHPMQGFTDGVMVVGPYAGRKVAEVKPIIKDEMIAAGTAMPYSEPEKQVGVGQVGWKAPSFRYKTKYAVHHSGTQ